MAEREQGADTPTAAFKCLGFRRDRSCVAVNRFCALGWMRTNWRRPRSWPPVAVRDWLRREIISRVPMGSDGGRWPTDPAVAMSDVLRAALPSRPT